MVVGSAHGVVAHSALIRLCYNETMVRHQRGFTIIEVLLFLSISGLLMALLFVGTGIAIQRQQYQDTIQSFASFLRGQYAAMVSVENDNEAGEKCPIDNMQAARGQSNCVIVGRYLQADGADGKTYETFPIYAKQSGDTWQYRYGQRDGVYDLSWDARTKLAGKQDSDEVKFSLAMYRHPKTGQVAIKSAKQTYTAGQVGGLLGLADDTTTQELCVYDTGWLPNERRSIFLSPHSESSDAISIKPAEQCHDS